MRHHLHHPPLVHTTLQHARHATLNPPHPSTSHLTTPEKDTIGIVIPLVCTPRHHHLPRLHQAPHIPLLAHIPLPLPTPLLLPSLPAPTPQPTHTPHHPHQHTMGSWVMPPTSPLHLRHDPLTCPTSCCRSLMARAIHMGTFTSWSVT